MSRNIILHIILDIMYNESQIPQEGLNCELLHV